MPARSKGVVTRALPDFYAPRMNASFGFVSTATPNEACVIYLYNNATQGEILVVWSIEAATKIETGETLTDEPLDLVLSPTRQFTFSFDSQGINTAGPNATSPGLVNANTTGVFPVGDSFLRIFPGNGYTWPHDWPLCEIWPGYQLIVYSSSGAKGFFGTVSFMWEVAPSITPPA